MAFEVKFDTGQTIKFQNKPTQKDIDEAAKQLNLSGPQQSQQAPEPKKGGLFGNIVRGALKPAVTLGVRPFQAAESLISTIRDPLKEPDLDVNLPFFGKIEAPKTGKDIIRDVGRGAETIALGVGAGAARQVGRQALGGAVREAAKRGAVGGAKAGFLSGAGGAAAREGRIDLGTAFEGVGGAATGALAGGVLGGGAGALGAGASRALRGVGRELPGRAGQLQRAGRERVSKSLRDKVMPALTAKERRLAKAQNRVVRGKTSSVFGKQPDIVKPDRATEKAMITLQRRIKGVNKMDDIQIAQASQSEIAGISQRLKPSMQRVRLAPETLKSSRQTWDKLKIKQAAEPEFDAFAGSKKFQQRFESFLNDMKKNVRDPASGKFRPKNLDDLWEMAKRYDDIVPDRVKQATEASDATLQFQKDMWLDNRRILRSILKDTSSGLGKKARDSFSDMTDLYRIRNNIINRTDVATKAEPGLFRPRNLAIGAGVLGVPTAAQILARNRGERLR